MVTPVEKLGQPTRVLTLSSNGTTVRFDTTGGNGLPGTGAHGPTFNSYVARRDAHRWDYNPMNLPASEFPAQQFVDTTASIDQQLFRGVTNVATTESAYFWRRVGEAPVQATPNLLSRGGPWVNSLPQYYGASADLEHVVFFANSNTVGEPEVAFLPSDPPPAADGSSPRKLYESVAGDPGTVRRIDVDGLGQPISSCSDPFLGSDARTERAVSADGQRIFFTARPDCSDPAFPGRQHLYARLGGEDTVELSSSECGRTADPGATPPVTACAPVTGDAQYESASEDAEQVFFTSPDQLVDADTDTTNDLYRYDFSAPLGSRLSLVSEGDGSDATPGAGADVEGVVRISGDGRRTYFVARGVLTTGANDEGQQAVEGGDNLYLADAGSNETTFVGLLDPGDASLWSIDVRAAQLADPAGRYLVFASMARMTGDDTDGAQDVYRYDADNGALERVSIPHDDPGGGNDEVAARIIPLSNVTSSSPAAVASSRNVSGDGARIVFVTAEALQQDDVNNAVDLYEWHDGRVDRISDGQHPTGIHADRFLISEDGSTVAFSTSARLLPERDRDTTADVYVARFGSDVDPLPGPPPTPCAGQQCQTPPDGPPGPDLAGTVTFNGAGNLLPALGKSAVSVRVTGSKKIVGSRGTFRVTLPERGRLTTSGSGIKATKRTVAKAGTYSVQVALSNRAAKLLKKKQTFKTRLRMTFQPSLGVPRSQSIAVTFRVASKKKGRS